MKNSDPRLDRLLRAAAEAPNELPNEMPFAFDTRVLAGWRAAAKSDVVAVGRLLGRVVLLSLAVIALATAGVYNDLEQGEDPFLDQYTIADAAISNAVEL
jgi:hypothetical protein